MLKLSELTALLGVIVLFGGGCTYPVVKAPGNEQMVREKSPPEIQDTNSGNLFQRDIAQIGDKVTNMQITSIDNRFVKFKGTVTVTGTVEIYPENSEDFMAGNICFRVNENEWSTFPRVLGDSRIVWFCFSNRDEAKKKFTSMGVATIIVDDYVIDNLEAATWNTAKLIDVVKMTP